MLSFESKKQIRTVITIGTGSFTEFGTDQIQLVGYRTSVSIENAGWVQMGELRAEIFGLKQSDMNTVTSYPMSIGRQKQNTIVVYAIDGDQETVVFAGNIVRAWPDYAKAPDVSLSIQAQAAYSAALKTVQPRSFKGAVDAAVIFRQLAESMGLAFENAGVSVTLVDQYLQSNDLEQVRDLARASGIEMNIERGILSIWQKGSYRNSSIPLISRDTGMVGYPSYDGAYMKLQCLHNPNLITGGLCKVESDNIPANGQWQVLKMSHRLESEKPDGAWFTDLICVNLNTYGR